MRRRRPAADAADRTPGILVPPGSGQARERRNEVDPARVGNRGGKGLDLRRGADDPQAVAQPLHDRTPDEDASLEGVVHLPADLPRHGGQQVVLRKNRTIPAVHQQKATRAVGIFHRARFGAHLPEKRRLLVARNARDGNLVGEDRRLRRAVDLARRLHLGHHRPRDVEEFQQVVVPLQRVDVEEHRARGVAHVGHMHLPACQPPDEPRVDRPEEELALLGPRPGSRNVVEDPLDLRRAEVRVDDQARFRSDVFRLSLGLQAVAVLRGPAVLPHDGVVDRFLGLHVPDDGRLALVRDADAGDVESVDVDRGDRLGDDRSLRSPDFVGIVFHPAGFGEVLRKFTLSHGTDLPLAVENDGPRAARSLVQRQDVLIHKFGI